MEAASVGARAREVVEARLTELETVLTAVFDEGVTIDERRGVWINETA